jgi:hypothetical protein
MINHIITHPGGAHFDELLAISLITASYKDIEFKIHRRKPTREELNNPEIWVVDVGNRFQPELKNFDHHQDLNLCASFVLIADFLELTEKLKAASWWNFKDRIDRVGPTAMAEELGIDKLSPLYSPFESWFLNLFSEDPQSVYEFIRKFGRDIIDQAELLESQIQFWKSCKTINIKNKIIIVGLTDDSGGLQEYCDSLTSPLDVSITYDRRGGGWRLYRFNDSKGVDFCRIKEYESISFAHYGGFIAKTKKRIPLNEVYKLIDFAIEEK